MDKAQIIGLAPGEYQLGHKASSFTGFANQTPFIRTIFRLVQQKPIQQDVNDTMRYQPNKLSGRQLEVVVYSLVVFGGS